MYPHVITDGRPCLDKANDELHRAHEDMDRRFSDAINKINHVQIKVDDATANLKGLNNKFKSAKANRDRADKRRDYIAKAYWVGTPFLQIHIRTYRSNI